MGDTGKCA